MKVAFEVAWKVEELNSWLPEKEGDVYGDLNQAVQEILRLQCSALFWHQIVR
jgi:hypothetical protein